MSEKKFVLTTAYDKTVGLLLEDGKPWDLRCYDNESRLGNIYVGRVSNVLDNISAAFIDIEKGLSCYLPFDELPKGKKVKIGDMLTVQLIRESLKTKQPTVTTKLSLTGRYAVITLDATVGVSSKIKDADRREELKQLLATEIKKAFDTSDKLLSDTLADVGGVIRTQAEKSENEPVAEEIHSLYRKLSDILKSAKYATIYSCLHKNCGKYIEDALFFKNQDDTKVVTDLTDVVVAIDDKTILYDDKTCPLKALYNVEGVIQKALSRIAYLKSGAYLVIEPTEAMTVIDVNSGKAIKGKNSEEALHKINLEAAKEVARQLRLRNISGIIMVDFISNKSEQKDKELIKELEKETSKDYVMTNVVDITRLGLVELTRKKVRRPLYESIRITK